jgi:hypothetical protein
LKSVFELIVLPLTAELKTLMFDFIITNEAELFCSDLSFKMNDDTGSKYIGDPSSKPDDSVNKLNIRLTEIRKRYESIMLEMDDFKTSDDNKKLIAQAIYFATYYHPKNEDFNEYSAF